MDTIQNPRRHLLLFDRPDNPALWSRCFIYSSMTGDGLPKQAMAVPRRPAISLSHGSIGTEPQPFPEGFLLGLKRYQLKLGRHAISCKRQRLIGREIEVFLCTQAWQGSINEHPWILDICMWTIALIKWRPVLTVDHCHEGRTWVSPDLNLGIAAHICVHVQDIDRESDNHHAVVACIYADMPGQIKCSDDIELITWHVTTRDI